MMKFIKKALYYLSVIPPIVNAFREYIQVTRELSKQLKALNDAVKMENDFEEANSDD